MTSRMTCLAWSARHCRGCRGPCRDERTYWMTATATLSYHSRTSDHLCRCAEFKVHRSAEDLSTCSRPSGAGQEMVVCRPFAETFSLPDAQLRTTALRYHGAFIKEPLLLILSSTRAMMTRAGPEISTLMKESIMLPTGAMMTLACAEVWMVTKQPILFSHARAEILTISKEPIQLMQAQATLRPRHRGGRLLRTLTRRRRRRPTSARPATWNRLLQTRGPVATLGSGGHRRHR
mmetsp:Transcript_91599/g.172514  ORF Transcript_91599/g.172514 Transcript_91599/m.172514 type:complete len:234 (+) Transcript_91599:40-741(+)